MESGGAESGGGGGGGSLREGMKIEARYRGKARYYPGKLARDRGMGKWDIDYDDGEKEYGVDEEMIRALDGGDMGGRSSPSRGGGGGGEDLREGMKVEARYRGKTRYYPGVIRRDNRDGTYDINYDDGEKEMGVREELIKALESGAGGGGGG